MESVEVSGVHVAGVRETVRDANGADAPIGQAQAGDSAGSAASARSIYGAPIEPSWTIRRPALVSTLDDAHSVTVVRGGSGFGKTMLVAQWANAAAVDGVWIDVDTELDLALADQRLRALSSDKPPET